MGSDRRLLGRYGGERRFVCAVYSGDTDLPHKIGWDVTQLSIDGSNPPSIRMLIHNGNYLANMERVLAGIFRFVLFQHFNIK